MTRTPTRARRSRRAPLALALTATALLAPTAAPALAADPGWQPTATLTTAEKDGNDPRVVRAADGSATAIWVRSSDDSIGSTVVQTATRPLGGAWSEPRTLSLGSDQRVQELTLAIGDDGTVAAAWEQRKVARPAPAWQVQAAVKPAGGDWTTPAAPTSEPGATFLPSLVVDPEGTATIAWMRTGDDAFSHIEVAESTPDGGWTTPEQATMTPDAEEPQLARGADGTLALAWRDYDNGTGNYTVVAATRPADSDTWNAPRQLSDSARYSYGTPDVVVGPAGETTVVFQTRTDNARYSRYMVQSSSWTPAAGWDAAPQLVTPDDRTVSAQDPQLGIDDAGNVTAAFLRTDYDGDDTPGVRATVDNIQVATLPAGADAWGAPETIGQEPPNATLRKVTLAVGGNGATTVAWAGYTSAAKTAKIVRAARREAGATSWSTPLELSGEGGTASTQLPFVISLAADRLGATTVAWHINDSTATTLVQAADYEVERPAPVVPAPGPAPVVPAPVVPAPAPAPSPAPPVTTPAPAARSVRVQLAWRGKRLVVRAVGAPAKARLRITIGTGRKARTIVVRGRSVALSAKLVKPRQRIVVRVLDTRGKRLKVTTLRAPRR